MAAFESVDIHSEAFQLRLANLLVATRTRNGLGVGQMVRASEGRFSKRDLKEFESGKRALDETTIDELASLYRADLGAILPLRLPVVISANRVSAGGVHEEYDSSDPDGLLAAYLSLVRTLRRQRRSPVVDLRRDDVEVLAGFLQEPHDTVVHRLATLMHATQSKRTAMVGVLATGAVVVGLVGTAAAVGVGDATPSGTPDSTVVIETTVPVTDSVVETTVPVTDSVVDSTTTLVVETTVASTTVAPPPVTTQAPPVTTAKPPVTAPPTTVPSIETNLPPETTQVGTGGPPVPTPPAP
ncbi:MAG: hypothetical protein RL238_776 [Actinomycetota bacterium]|jgi:hypothetical protein